MLFITCYQSQKSKFLYSHDFFPCTSLRRPIDSCLLHQEASSIAGSLFLVLLFSRRLTASRHHQQRALPQFVCCSSSRSSKLLEEPRCCWESTLYFLIIGAIRSAAGSHCQDPPPLGVRYSASSRWYDLIGS
jgi:hypothetical protein